MKEFISDRGIEYKGAEVRKLIFGNEEIIIEGKEGESEKLTLSENSRVTIGFPNNKDLIIARATNSTSDDPRGSFAIEVVLEFGDIEDAKRARNEIAELIGSLSGKGKV